MANSDLVRSSRDGDQFHYWWAARRCLPLLMPNATLKAVTIEGPSLSEAAPDNRITTGDELIDVGEYHGDERIEHAERINYMQLKHSTVRTDQPWQPSELEKTLSGFAKRYDEFLARIPEQDANAKLQFWFVSNRPIKAEFLETVVDAAAGNASRHPDNLKKLETFTGFRDSKLEAFCKLLKLDGNQEGLWHQENMLPQDLRYCLPEQDGDAPLQLKELVTRKATSEGANNPAITKTDVLRALKTDEEHLFPAPCLIQDVEHVVPREQEAEIINAIVQANVPVIVHADGGVGKSVFATCISTGLPAGSVCVVYDCFGNGDYRKLSSPRHRHTVALVQIANELAAKGACYPLIPSPKAEQSDYVRAFLDRIRQSVNSLRSKNAQALVCVVIDAADNSGMAAEENHEGRSFARDLLKESLPDGMRLVATCRTHRQQYLDPPPAALCIELQSFSRAETAKHLRQTYAEASEQDVDEFHRLSSQNPRVQAGALSQNRPLGDTLRALGPERTTVETTLDKLLEDSMARLRHSAGAEQVQIDKICTALAALRPFVPLAILAAMSGVPESAVRSFLVDLGRPLFVGGGLIQFIDEPSETWFRRKFKPTDDDLKKFIAALSPLASRNPYVASVLPQLMLDAGQLSDLVDLALHSRSLPENNPIERRDVELQRLQFAIKASIRAIRYIDAAKLALKAGGVGAGDERQRKLIQGNTDLAAHFLSEERLHEFISRTTLASGWRGSHHAYEAGLLSWQTGLVGDARSRLRMANEWLVSWSRLPDKERQKEEVSDDDVLEMVTAHFNIYGADRCVLELRRWHSRQRWFRVGRMLASRLVDHGCYSKLHELALTPKSDLHIILAITAELRRVHQLPPKAAVESALRVAPRLRGRLTDGSPLEWDDKIIESIIALVEAAHLLGVGTTNTLIELLTRYLPASSFRILASPHNPSRFSYLRAYALRAALRGQQLTIIDLAHDELRKELESAKSHSESEGLREFKHNIGALLPWHMLWAEMLVGRSVAGDISNAIEATLKASASARGYGYRQSFGISDEIAQAWFDIILHESRDPSLLQAFEEWRGRLELPLRSSTLTHFARTGARSQSTFLQEAAFKYAADVSDRIADSRDDATTKLNEYIGLARALKGLSFDDAKAYFETSAHIADKIGDENLDRWRALLELADRARIPGSSEPIIAYRFARCAEVTRSYLDRDKYMDWESTTKAICGLCPRSSLAILSRWRDRDSGRTEWILPGAIECLVERDELDPQIAVALFGLRAQWHKPPLVQRALDVCTAKAEKIIVADLVYRYMTLEQQSTRVWRKLREVVDSHGIVLPGLDIRIEMAEREERAKQLRDSRSSRAYITNSKESRDWDAIFAGLNVALANDISQGYRRFTALGPVYDYIRFFQEACRRVPVGQEAKFLEAIADGPALGLFHVEDFLKQIPERWSNRPAVKKALGQTLKTICRRYCMKITKSRYYDPFPFELACRLTGLGEVDFIDEVLAAISESTADVNTDRFFSVVEILVPKLDSKQALEVLSFGLDLFDSELKETDGDGSWSSRLLPPAEMEGSVAGYVWRCLGAPQASLRWEAVHVVRALCTLGQQKVIRYLIDFANETPAKAFHDNDLPFYDRHARQWLLIALARSAKEGPDFIVLYADFLLKIAFGGEPHVLMREFAKRAILALLDAGYLQDQPDLPSRLASINQSPFPAIRLKSQERYDKMRATVDDSSLGGRDNEERHHFNWDLGNYWLAPLGECFAKSQAFVEHHASKVIRTDWQISASKRTLHDARHRRKIFKDGETRYSHYSYPHVDDLHFYLSYHAMMVVAGKFLTTTPVHQEPNDEEDGFQEWLRRHDLSRGDGGWLSDRRDPVPLERPSWKDEEEADDWRWSIARVDFERNLIASDHRLNLWGRWALTSGRREETIGIASAFVSSDRSMALLRALQSARNPHDYSIPDADDTLQIEEDGFQLKGWILDDSLQKELESQDPWAGAIRFPLLAPSTSVREIMKLQPDKEQRCWRIDGEGVEVAWSQVWGHLNDNDDLDANHEYGTRFQASFSFVRELLHQLTMDLIVGVEIERKCNYPQWDSRRDEEIEGIEFIPTSARLFVISADGRIRSM